MKLVDILARELKAWPSHIDFLCIYDAGLPYPTNTIYGKTLSHVFEFNGYWDIPCDYKTARVTRAEWQAAVDALNAPKVVEWDGAGLPPIDIEVEFRPDMHAKWCVATAKYHSLDFSVFSKFGEESPIWNPRSWQFRPIRTAEQVAAEELEAIREFLISEHNNGGLIGIAKALHESGYRKQVAK